MEVDMWHDNETSRDLIGFERFAITIASLVTDPQVLPLTVGLFGDWGGGKSSVLRMMERRLGEQESVLTLRFDGWLFEGYDDAKAALMTAIVDRLSECIRKNQTLWERTKPRVMRLLRRINWFRVVGLAAKGVVALSSPLDVGLLAGLTTAEAVQFLAEKTQDAEKFQRSIRELLGDDSDESPSSEAHESVRQFRTEFQSLLKESGISTLVVLIDDLDRCLPESIVSTLEAIKLFLSVRGTAFVIAADERIVRLAISTRYPAAAHEDSSIIQEYLDKLVQIPFLPYYKPVLGFHLFDIQKQRLDLRGENIDTADDQHVVGPTGYFVHFDQGSPAGTGLTPQACNIFGSIADHGHCPSL